MTPKEKAQELFDKFNYPDTTNYPYVHNAQQCALILVDEIINETVYNYDTLHSFDRREYWTEVKQEIKKI